MTCDSSMSCASAVGLGATGATARRRCGSATMVRAVMRTSPTISSPSSRTSSAATLGVGDVAVRDVQPEALTLDATTVAEVDLEIDLDPILAGAPVRPGRRLIRCR